MRLGVQALGTKLPVVDLETAKLDLVLGFRADDRVAVDDEPGGIGVGADGGASSADYPLSQASFGVRASSQTKASEPAKLIAKFTMSSQAELPR